jgi:hypothetical protein
MTMPLLSVDEDEREEDDTGPSILRDSQFRIARGDVVEDPAEGVALDAPPQLLRGGVLDGRRRAIALVVRQLRETALREECCPLVLVVGILEGIVALLLREHLVVVLVDGGLSRRAVGHRQDWDPAGAQPPRPGTPEKSGNTMYRASYRACASHLWR